MSEVRIFHTHIEVYPYEQGDCPEIEKMMSKYVAITRYNSKPVYKLVPVAYFIQNDILYLPRGINGSLLQNFFHTTPTPVSKCDEYTKIKKGVGNFKANSLMQENAMKFLCGEKEYGYTSRYSQLGLNLQTGDGKTYSAVYSILKLKIKAIIITHQDKLKKQWIKTLNEMTSFPPENICNVSGTEVMDEIMKGDINAEIYCVNHQTIHAYASVHGWLSIREFFRKIKVGIKVIDEAHKFFESTLMIDYFSNCYKSFYLTASFGRPDNSEGLVYKRAFSSMVRFGEETINYEEKRKHINFVVVYFNSRPTYGMLPNLKTGYGFSGYKYIDYELSEENHSLQKVLTKILEQTGKMEGKTLITLPKTESVDTVANLLTEYTDKSIGTVHSKNSVADNDANLQKDIICSTVKSVGEGVDIKGLRVLINLEPIGNKILADQVAGRLREYSKTEDTYLFYPVDMMVPETSDFLKRILPTMKKKCKEIIFMKMQV